MTCPKTQIWVGAAQGFSLCSILTSMEAQGFADVVFKKYNVQVSNEVDGAIGVSTDFVSFWKDDRSVPLTKALGKCHVW